MSEQPVERRKLYRSRTDRYIAGVCGGIAEYFNIDSNLVRILFVLSVFLGGAGLILYLAAVLIVPENPAETGPARSSSNSTVFWGLVLIVLGTVLLLKQLGFYLPFNLANVPWSVLWALFLIAIGVLLLLPHWQQKSSEEAIDQAGGEPGEAQAEPEKRLFRSRTDRMLAGICGGLGQFFGIDSSIVRLIWVLLTVASGGLGVIIYLLLIFVLPEEPGELTA